MKKYDELTDEQKKQVSVMYADKTPLDEFVYDFDDNGNFHGRKPISEYVEEDRTFSDVVEDVKEAVTGKKSKSKKANKK